MKIKEERRPANKKALHYLTDNAGLLIENLRARFSGSLQVSMMPLTWLIF